MSGSQPARVSLPVKVCAHSSQLSLSGTFFRGILSYKQPVFLDVCIFGSFKILVRFKKINFPFGIKLRS